MLNLKSYYYLSFWLAFVLLLIQRTVWGIPSINISFNFYKCCVIHLVKYERCGTNRVRFKSPILEIRKLCRLEIFVNYLGKQTKQLYQSSSLLLLAMSYIMQIEKTDDISGKSMCLQCKNFPSFRALWKTIEDFIKFVFVYISV